MYFSSIGASGDSFIDVKDAQWLLAEDLTPLDIDSITPSQFVVYRFGVFLIRFLRRSMNTPDVTLLLASALPPNNYEKNMFRRSFFYQHAKKILFIRQERLESVGEFLLVIAHCMAHVKTGDLTNDSDPSFMREFYKVSSLETSKTKIWIVKELNLHSSLTNFET